MYKGDSRIVIQQNSEVKIWDEILIVSDSGHRYIDAFRPSPGTNWVIRFYTKDELINVTNVSGSNAVMIAGLQWIEA